MTHLLCEHNKRKSRCKKCGGSEICNHNNYKSRCKECGGKEICEHNRRKSRCKECGGKEICEHNKRKSTCKECSGSQICEHNHYKSTCKECFGGSICEHNRVKSVCIKCEGSQICEHNRRKSQCKECGGGSICEHNRIRSRCKECGGGSICLHNKHKSLCKECGGSALCKTPLCDTKSTKKYDGYCLTCFVHLFPDKPNARNYKTKEQAVVEYVFEQFPLDKYTWISDKRVYDGCSRRRPDLFLDLGYQVIVVEVDENQHIDYDCSCENKRLMEISQDINHRPLIFIRFNPDTYHNKDGIVTSCWGNNQKGLSIIKKSKQNEWCERLETLRNQIEYWIQPQNKIEKTLEIIQLFYDSD